MRKPVNRSRFSTLKIRCNHDSGFCSLLSGRSLIRGVVSSAAMIDAPYSIVKRLLQSLGRGREGKGREIATRRPERSQEKKRLELLYHCNPRFAIAPANCKPKSTNFFRVTELAGLHSPHGGDFYWTLADAGRWFSEAYSGSSGGRDFFLCLRRRHVSRSSANEVSNRKKRVSAPALTSGKIGYD